MDKFVFKNQLKIAIRDAREADLSFFEDLYHQTRREEFAPLGWDENQLHMFLRMQFDLQTQGYRMQYPEARVSVIESGGKPVGRMLTSDDEAEAIRLVDIAVLPESRDLGIGSFVLRALQNEAMKIQKGIALQVIKTNIPAIHLYEKFGFNITGENDLYLEMNWRE